MSFLLTVWSILMLLLKIAVGLFVVIVVFWKIMNVRYRKSTLQMVHDLHTVSLADREAAIECIKRAEKADSKTFIYDITAPIVMLFVLPFVKREANKLPGPFSKYDNNYSLNGDAMVVLRDGKWVVLRDGVEALPGEKVYSYDSPEYTGDAYYAKGHHPRSFIARYIWVGWRNRASALSLSYGVPVPEYPVFLHGSRDIGRSNPGSFLLKQDKTYHFKSFELVKILGMMFVLIRSVGYKLEIALMHASGTAGPAAAVAIWWSLKGAK